MSAMTRNTLNTAMAWKGWLGAGREVFEFEFDQRRSLLE
jgi:hypothetical protein